MDPTDVGPLPLLIAVLVVGGSAAALYQRRRRSERRVDPAAPPQDMIIRAGDLLGLAKSGAFVFDGRDGRYTGGLDEKVSGTQFFGYQIEWRSEGGAPVRLDLLFRGPSAEADRQAILAVEVDGSILFPDARSTRDIRKAPLRIEVESALMGIRAAAAKARMQHSGLGTPQEAEQADRMQEQSD
jgi:hypothetical protein